MFYTILSTKILRLAVQKFSPVSAMIDLCDVTHGIARKSCRFLFVPRFLLLTTMYKENTAELTIIP